MSNSTPGTDRAASPTALTDAQMRIVLFATLRAEVQSAPEEPYLLLKSQETDTLKAHPIGDALYVGKNPQNLPEFAQGLELGGDSELSRQHFRVVRVEDSFVLPMAPTSTLTPLGWKVTGLLPVIVSWLASTFSFSSLLKSVI